MPQDINALRSKKSVRVPTAMTREETFNLIGAMHGTHQLMAKLMYGSGLRKPGGQVFILHTRPKSVKNEDLTPMSFPSGLICFN